MAQPAVIMNLLDILLETTLNYRKLEKLGEL